MEIILLKNVTGLGALGDKVKVRSGYGRNYLLPQRFAVSATASNLEAFEARRAELEREAAGALGAAEARKASMEGLNLTIARKAGDEGRLFGSVGTQDIAAAAVALGIAMEKQEVRLSDGAFRNTGEYEVVVHLHPEVETNILVTVVPES